MGRVLWFKKGAHADYKSFQGAPQEAPRGTPIRVASRGRKSGKGQPLGKYWPKNRCISRTQGPHPFFLAPKGFPKRRSRGSPTFFPGLNQPRGERNRSGPGPWAFRLGLSPAGLSVLPNLGAQVWNFSKGSTFFPSFPPVFLTGSTQCVFLVSFIRITFNFPSPCPISQQS